MDVRVKPGRREILRGRRGKQKNRPWELWRILFMVFNVISDVDIRWWSCLNEVYGFSGIATVCDLGLQEISPNREAKLQCALKDFAALCGFPGANLENCRLSAELWRRLGREIVSLDVVGDDASLIKFDLNHECVPQRLRGHFDFVTNVGTSEHIFNQLNFFKVMHDLTGPKGVMVHVLPSGGYETHGFFTYPIKFFWRLAFANDYHCLDLWSSAGRMPSQKPNVAEFLNNRHDLFTPIRSSPFHPLRQRWRRARYFSIDRGLFVFLKKTSDRPFRVPIDTPD